MTAIEQDIVKNDKTWKEILLEVHWHTAIMTTFIYFGGFYGFYQLITGHWMLLTFGWMFLMYVFGGIGQSVAGHRLFSHRSFKVNRPLKIFLLFCHTVSGQLTVLIWSRVHRAHHKFTDTPKDPTNINKGFLFSHIFWKFWFSPEVLQAMESIDMSDLLNDKDVMFQANHYFTLHFMFTWGLPILVPYYFWKETLSIAVYANAFRWLLNLNQMSLANSLMHMKGSKPYDGRISAGENLFCIIYTYGEGFHNYHHVFPWDYKTGEFGDLTHFNLSAMIIDMFHKFGWVTERKAVSQEMIARRKARTGDGTHWLAAENAFKNPVWGYGDVDMDIDDKMEIHAHFKDDFFKDKKSS